MPILRSLLLVPWTPGARIPLDEDRRPERGVLEESLDERFGEPTREGPAAFDVVLLSVAHGWS